MSERNILPSVLAAEEALKKKNNKKNTEISTVQVLNNANHNYQQKTSNSQMSILGLEIL